MMTKSDELVDHLERCRNRRAAPLNDPPQHMGACGVSS